MIKQLIYSKKDGLVITGNDLSDLDNLIKQANDIRTKRPRFKIRDGKHLKTLSKEEFQRRVDRIKDLDLLESIDNELKKKAKEARDNEIYEDIVGKNLNYLKHKSDKSINRFIRHQQNLDYIRNKRILGSLGGTAIGAGVGALSVPLLLNNIKAKLERKHPDWTEKELDEKANKYMRILLLINTSLGAIGGAYIGNKVGKSIGLRNIRKGKY